MAFSIAALLLAFSVSLSSTGEAKFDRSIITRLDERFSIFLLDQHKAEILAGLEQLWPQSTPTLREVIQTRKSSFYNLPTTQRDRVFSAGPYQPWVGYLQKNLADVNLSLEMSDFDVEEFSRYPERILFRGLRSLKGRVEFYDSLLGDLEQLGVFTVYDLLREFPNPSEFIEYVHQIAMPGPIFAYGSFDELKADYAFLREQDAQEKKAIKEMSKRYEALLSRKLREALSQAGVEELHQLFNYSFAYLVECMIQDGRDVGVIAELLLLLNRLGIQHSLMECSSLFNEDESKAPLRPTQSFL